MAKVFNTLVNEEGVIVREWVDHKGEPYKYEIKTPIYQGYLNPLK